jgi:hypothetical protein
VSLAYRGKNFPIDGSQVCDNPPWQSTQARNLSDPIERVEWTDGWKAAVEPFQRRLSDGLRASREVKPTAEFPWPIMSKAYGCHGVSLRGGSGAHAIALRLGRDNRYRRFDSNDLHVAMAGVDAFKSFVTWYLDKTGYAKRYKAGTGVVGIKPPITAAS